MMFMLYFIFSKFYLIVSETFLWWNMLETISCLIIMALLIFRNYPTKIQNIIQNVFRYIYKTTKNSLLKLELAF